MTRTSSTPGTGTSTSTSSIRTVMHLRCTSLKSSLTPFLSVSTFVLILLILSASTQYPVVLVVEAGGAFQSGPNNNHGARYAGGLDYVGGSVYITGIGYNNNNNKNTKTPSSESSCFVSKLSSNYLQHHSVAVSSTVGSGDIMEVCSGLSLLHDPLRPRKGEHKPFVIVGTVDPTGLYNPSDTEPAGFLMSLDPRTTHRNTNHNFEVKTGTTFHYDQKTDDSVSYPISVLYEYDSENQDELYPADEFDFERKNGRIFIASLSSIDLGLSLDYGATLDRANDAQQPMQPNWMKFRKYGSSFEMTISKYRTHTSEPMDNGDEDFGEVQHISSEWVQSYPIDIDPGTGTKPDVYLGGMIRKKIPNHPGKDNNNNEEDSWLAEFEGDIEEILIVGGSTRGMGIGYGDAVGEDEDGFISVLSTENGQLISGNDNNQSNKRIGTDATDLILGICDDPTDINAFYIVGTTGDHVGEMGTRLAGTVKHDPQSMHGYVQKISLHNLKMLWGVTWTSNYFNPTTAETSTPPESNKSPTVTAGTGCHVLPDGSVYVVGLVENGANVLTKNQRTSPHGDTILAMRLSSKLSLDEQGYAVPLWIEQFGSNDGDESFGNVGTTIAVDEQDNLIIYGDTTGSMYRERNSKQNGEEGDDDDVDVSSDLFLMTLNKLTGEYDPIGALVPEAADFVPPITATDFFGLDDVVPAHPHSNEMITQGDYLTMDEEERWKQYEEGKWDGFDGDGSGEWGGIDLDDDHAFMGGKYSTDGSQHDYGGYGEDGSSGNNRAFNNARFGIQSGEGGGGSTFAGGMVYNAEENTVYLAGIAYDDTTSQPNCIIKKVPLENDGPPQQQQWIESASMTFGNSNTLESCSSVALHRYGEVVTVGNADAGSSLLSSNSQGTGDAADLAAGAGFALALDRNNLGRLDSTPLISTSAPLDKITYPVSVYSDGGDLYIVSSTTTNSNISREYKNAMTDATYSPNYINMQKYGSSLDMTVTKLTLTEEVIDGVSDGDIAFQTVWSKEFPVTPDGDGSGQTAHVYLGGAIIVPSQGANLGGGGGYLAIAGSTRGMGDGYGAAVGNDEDGFITLLDLQTGELSQDVDRNNIREGSDQDDIVLGICHDRQSMETDDHSFYVVGGTKGIIGTPDSTLDIPENSMQAFIRKVDGTTLAEIWTMQWGAIHCQGCPSDTPTTAKAIACAVSGDMVYVGGIVDADAEMVIKNSPRKSQGGDDIWVAALNTQGGEYKWMRQAGSTGNDRIAPRGGLAISQNGNVIVYGDTTGSLFRDRSSDGESNNYSNKSDLFVMEFGKNGLHKAHIRAPRGKIHAPASSALPEDAPAPTPAAGAPTVQAQPVQLAPVILPDPPSSGSNVNKNESSEGSTSGTRNKIPIWMIVCIGVGSFILVFAGFKCVSYCSNKKKPVYGRSEKMKKSASSRKSIKNNKNNKKKTKIRDGLIINKQSSSRYSDDPHQEPPRQSLSQNIV